MHVKLNPARRVLAILALGLSFAGGLYAKLELVDEQVVEFYFDKTTIADPEMQKLVDYMELVTKIDLDRPDLDGNQRTLQSIVLRRLASYDVLPYVHFTDEDAEKFLADLQKRNHLSRDQLVEMFDQLGYAFADALQEVKLRYLEEQAIDLRVRSHKDALVTRAEVEAYDAAHPAFSKSEVRLVQVRVPGDTPLDKNWTDAELAALAWEEPFIVAESDLSESKKFIAQAAPGSIVDRERVDGGMIELTRLVEKRPSIRLSIDDKQHYDDIAQVLFGEKFEALLQAYQEELFAKAKAIAHFTPGYGTLGAEAAGAKKPGAEAAPVLEEQKT